MEVFNFSNLLSVEVVAQWCFVKKVFLETLHLCQSLFFNKVAGLRPAALLKKRLWHRCFPVNFAKFLRTTFLTEHLRWLLLLVIEWWDALRNESVIAAFAKQFETTTFKKPYWQASVILTVISLTILFCSTFADRRLWARCFTKWDK